MNTKTKKLLQGTLLAVAALMIAYGVSDGEIAVILNKAINVCFECIGLG